MKSRPRITKRRPPRTIHSLISQEEVNRELNKAGLTNEDLKEIREQYFQPFNRN